MNSRLMIKRPIYLLILPFFLFSSLMGQEEECCFPAEESFFYGKFGGGFLDVLNGGIGYRYFSNHFGFDIALEAGTKVTWNNLGIKLHPLYKFTPESFSSFYVGPGIGGNYAFLITHEYNYHNWDYEYKCRPEFFVQADICIGYASCSEWGKNCFFQVQVGSPVYPFCLLPLIRFEYGYSF